MKAEKSSNIKEQNVRNVENQNLIIGLEKNTFENGFLLSQQESDDSCELHGFILQSQTNRLHFIF